MNPEPGGLTVSIEPRSTTISMNGGGEWSLDVGPSTLVERELRDADPPTPEQLTNALAAVHDRFEDVLIDSPIVGAAPSVVVVGPHAVSLARVELGHGDVPADYVLRRSDADEVFRTLVAETVADRRHNPGLVADDVETIVGTCCVVLAIIRRLDLHEVGVAADGGSD